MFERIVSLENVGLIQQNFCLPDETAPDRSVLLTNGDLGCRMFFVWELLVWE